MKKKLEFRKNCSRAGALMLSACLLATAVPVDTYAALSNNGQEEESAWQEMELADGITMEILPEGMKVTLLEDGSGSESPAGVTSIAEASEQMISETVTSEVSVLNTNENIDALELTYDSPDGNFVYTYIETEEGITLTGVISYPSNESQVTFVMPSEINGVNVVAIGEGAFSGESGLKGQLIIPDTVTTIGKDAFSSCRSLTGELIIPESVTSIGERAFAYCSGFTGSLTIPENVMSLGEAAFRDCTGFTGDLTIYGKDLVINKYAFQSCNGFTGNLTLGEGVRSIGEYAFQNCNGFTGNLTLTEGVTDIGYGAFRGCNGLSGDLNIPGSVTDIGVEAFCGCSGFDGILILSEGLTSIGDWVFGDCTGLNGDLTIPNSVKSIEYSAFNGCSGFNGNLILSEGLTSIGNYAFRGCTSLNGDLNIPNSVTSIGFYAFYGCSLGSDVKLRDTVVSIGNRAFIQKDENGNEILPTIYSSQGSYAQEYALANEYSFVEWCWDDAVVDVTAVKLDATEIKVGEEGSFSYSISPENATYKALQWISSDETVISVDNGSFHALKEGTATITVTAHNGVSASLDVEVARGANGEQAVITYRPEGCEYDLFGVVKEDGITITGHNKAYNPAAALVIPDVINGITVTAIGDNAFYNGNFSGGLVLPETVTHIGDGAFYNCRELTGELVLPEKLEKIGVEAFCGCSGFSGDLIIPEGITSIGAEAFRNCEGFTGKLILPESLKTIGREAFYAGDFTGELVLPEGLEEIEEEAFWFCEEFTGDLVLPASITKISDGAFGSTGFDGKLVLHDGITVIGNQAFQNSKFTGELVLPKGLKYIGCYAFQDSKFTGELILPEGLQHISFYAFGNSDFTGELHIPDTVTRIEYGAFSGCDGFYGELKLPENLTYIGGEAFYYCKNLWGELVLPQSVKHVGSRAFGNIGFTGELNLPEGLESIGAWAFSYNDFTGDLVIPSTVKSIGEAAFYYCKGFDGDLIILGDTTIGERAFALCNNFTGDLIVTGDAHFVEGSFAECGVEFNNLILDGVTDIPDNLFARGFDYEKYYGNPKFHGELILEGTESIGDNAFYGQDEFIGALALPNTITTLGDVFGLENGYTYGLSGFITEQIVLPKSVTSCSLYPLFIEYVPVSHTRAIRRDAWGHLWYTISSSSWDDMMMGYPYWDYTDTYTDNIDSCYYFVQDKNYVSDDGTYGIEIVKGDTPVAGDLKISPNYSTYTVTRIGAYAYQNFTDITGLDIPSTVKRIDHYAFEGCTNLTGDLIFKSGLEQIGYAAFRDCDSLSGNICIPGSVTWIASRAFDITDEDGNPKEITIYAPKGSYGEAYALENGYNYVERNEEDGFVYIPEGDGVKIIGYENTPEGDLNIPNTLGGAPVIAIGENAFAGMTGFTGTLTIPHTVSIIGASAFENCSGLTGELVLPFNTKEIGDSAFAGCSGLTGELSIYEGIDSIGASAFENCSGLTGTLLIPASVQKIGNADDNNGPFAGCSGLETSVLFAARTEGCEPEVCPDAFDFIGDKSLVTLHAPVGSYWETFAAENGYAYCEETPKSEAEENEQLEEDSLTPLPDDYEQELEIAENQYAIKLVDEDGAPVAGASVKVRMEKGDGDWDTITTLTSDANGIVLMDVTEQIAGVTEGEYGIMFKATADVKLPTGWTTSFTIQDGKAYMKQNFQTLLMKAGISGYHSSGGWDLSGVDVVTGNKSYSIILNELLVPRYSDTVYTLKVTEEAWGNEETAEEIGPADYVQLVQGDKVLAKGECISETEEEMKEYTIKVALGQVVTDSDLPIYVQGIRKNGNKSLSKRLKITLCDNKLETMTPTIEVGSAFSPKVEEDDESIPFDWGKGSIEFDTLVDLPLEIEYEQNKVKVFVGGGKTLFEKSKKNTLKKDAIIKAIEEEIQKTTDKEVEIPVYPCVTLGFDVDIKGGGYLEGEVLSGTGNIDVEGAIFIKVSASVSATLQPKVWLIELPARISLEAEISDQASLKLPLSFRNSELVNVGPFAVENELEFALTLTGAVGIEDWWEYMAYGQVGASWTCSPLNTVEPNVVKLKGEAGLKRNTFFGEKYYWYWEDDVQLYPAEKRHGGGSSSGTGRQGGDSNGYAVLTAADEGYELISRDYLLDALTVNATEDTVVNGVYPYSAPRLVQLGDTYYLFYLNDIAGRADEDRTALVYRVNSGSGFGEEIVVEDDGTADYSFDVLAAEEGIHVLWQNTTTSMAGVEDLEETASKIQLKAAVVSGETVSETKVLAATEGKYPMSVSLFMDGTEVTAGWHENSANDFLSTGEGSNSFYVQKVNEDSRTYLGETDYYMGSAQFGVFRNQVCAVFSADVDGDFATMEDREIMVANEEGVKSLTFNAVLDSCPKFLNLNGTQYLVYYSGGNYVSFDGNREQTIVIGNDMISDSYRLYSDGSNAAIVWRNAYSLNSDVQTLSMAKYENGSWSQVGSVLDTTDNISAFDVSGSGADVKLAYTLLGEADGTEITRLCVAEADPKGQVALYSIDYDTMSFVPGENFPISLTLADAGLVPMEECIVRIVDEQEKVVWEKTLDTLPSGETTVDVNIDDFTPEAVTAAKTYRIVVLCDGTENIVQAFDLGGLDFTISHEITYLENDKMLNVQIFNDSQATGNVTFTISTDESEPVELYSKTYENVAPGCGKAYTCKLDTLLEQANGANLKLCITSDVEETTYVNNESTIVNYLAEEPSVTIELQTQATGEVAKELSLATGETLQLIAVLTGEGAENEQVTWSSSNSECVTVDENGKLTAVAEGVVSITAQTSEGVCAYCKVTVEKAQVAVEAVSLSATVLTLAPDERAVLEAVVTPKEATDSTITWSSTNTSVVQVEGGNLKAVAEGTAVISAVSPEGAYAACVVTVEEPVIEATGVTLDKSQLTLTMGDTASLTATVTPVNATDKTLSWSSDNEAVATVSDGVITAVSEGNATITVTTVNGLTATCVVTVKKETGGDETSVDKIALAAAITAAEALKEADYTEESWEALQTALTAAKAVNAEEEATQKEVDAATTALQEAVEALEESKNPDDGENPDDKDPVNIVIADLAEDHWSYPFVYSAIERNIMAGTDVLEDGSIVFEPTRKLTREMLAQILYNVELAEHSQLEVGNENPFSDVAEGNWYTTAVVWAAENGIVSGYPNGTFGVGIEISRREVATMLYNYAKYKGYDVSQTADMSQFVDTEEADWALSFMTWAVGAKVMSGQAGGILNPLGTADRATAATMMINFLNSYDE